MEYRRVRGAPRADSSEAPTQCDREQSEAEHKSWSQVAEAGFEAVRHTGGAGCGGRGNQPGQAGGQAGGSDSSEDWIGAAAEAEQKPGKGSENQQRPEDRQAVVEAG